jgi:hypothetical protein
MCAHLLAASSAVEYAGAVRLAVRQGFVLTRKQARVCGTSDATIRRLLRRRSWRPVRHGVITVIGAAVCATDERDEFERERIAHTIDSAAVALARSDHVVASTSAAVLWGLPVRRVPPDPIVTCPKVRPGGRTQATLIRRTTTRPFDHTTWFGVQITTPERTIVDLSRGDRGAGLMAADCALRDGLVTRESLYLALRWCAGWPGARSARLVASLADPLSESPLESLVRLALHESEFPAPELQVEVSVAGGQRSYRVDFMWRASRLILEADGRIKYNTSELWDEKRREMELTRAGFRVERVVWADLGPNWKIVAARLRHLLSLTPTT